MAVLATDRTAYLTNADITTDATGGAGVFAYGDGTVYVKGTGSYTITVENYSDSADFSGAATADSWSSHEAAKPEEIA